MGFERFIARRYIRSKQQTLFINIIMLVSVIGITVGVAALIIVLSVFNGFNRVVTDVLVAFDPHIRVLPAKGKSFAPSDTIARLLNAEIDVEAWSVYVDSKALLVSRGVNRVVLIRGVDESMIGEVSGVKNAIVLGQFDLGKESKEAGIVIGLSLADKLGATVGSEVTIVSPVGIDAMMVQFGQPEMKKFTVTGIYDSRNKEYDSHYAFIAIENAQSLFEYRGSVSGIEIRLHSIDASIATQAVLQERLGEGFKVLTWYDLHRDLYSVMQIERWSAYIILCLIVFVAVFNMLGSLTMGVIEKRRDIGVLKALGATNGSILRLFMFEGLLVGTVGTVLGIGIGLGVCYLQIHYQLFPLDPTVYIIPAIPVDIRWADFVTVGSASMLLSTFAALYPALRASRLTPVDAIRWE
ncbi:MAG: ABC transporter permease [Bacteroidetes bacterium]|nr:ABC transporter permease [Bacteroidota bacterium]MCW5896087.1 ABC transporter permease [Bacteroidota bacterium]